MDITHPTDHLQHALMDEIVHYLGWPTIGWPRRLLESIFWLPLQRFLPLVVQFDQIAGKDGFCEASRQVLPRLITRFEATGQENIPREGPLLLLTNHPGTFDALVAAANIHRRDFKTIARGMPFLRALPNAPSYLIFSTRDVHVKMTAARAAIQHLQEGGVLLLFPSGDMDPDPAWMPEQAQLALSKWSASVELLLRKAPQAQVQVAMMSGLLSPRFLNHPVARWRKDPHRRQIVAEIMQVLQQMLLARPAEAIPTITFGKPFHIPSGGGLEYVRDEARRLIKSQPCRSKKHSQTLSRL